MACMQISRRHSSCLQGSSGLRMGGEPKCSVWIKEQTNIKVLSQAAFDLWSHRWLKQLLLWSQRKVNSSEAQLPFQEKMRLEYHFKSVSFRPGCTPPSQEEQLQNTNTRAPSPNQVNPNPCWWGQAVVFILFVNCPQWFYCAIKVENLCLK